MFLERTTPLYHGLQENTDRKLPIHGKKSYLAIFSFALIPERLKLFVLVFCIFKLEYLALRIYQRQITKFQEGRFVKRLVLPYKDILEKMKFQCPYTARVDDLWTRHNFVFARQNPQTVTAILKYGLKRGCFVSYKTHR